MYIGMASFGGDAGEAKFNHDSLLGEEDVVLDQDHDFEDVTYRQAPPTFSSPDASQFSSEHFSVHDLEDSVMRSANRGGSSSYEMRGACVAGQLQQAPFSVGQAFAMPGMGQKPDVKALGLSADRFASLSSQAPHAHKTSAPEPPPLPPTPFFLDRNSFDLSRAAVPAQQLHTDLLRIFSCLEVDYVWKPEKWKFVCKAYPNDEPVDFRVRLYMRPGEKTYALEFQQRAGSRFGYHRLINRLKDSLHLSSEKVVPGPPMKSFAGNPQGMLAYGEINQVLTMLSSNFADVQREGLRIMCEFAQLKQAGDALVKTGAIASIVSCLKSQPGNHEIRRMVGKALCQFVKCYDLLLAVKEKRVAADKEGLFIDIVDAAIDLTKELPKSSTEPKYEHLSRIEIRRVGASLLCILVSWAEARKRIKDKGGEAALQEIIQDESPDIRLKEHAQDCILCMASM